MRSIPASSTRPALTRPSPSSSADRLQYQLLRGSAARGWAQTGENRAAWANLYERCPWSNPSLSPDFFEIWSECYAALWDPVLVLAFDATGQLQALAPLAARAHKVTGIGAHQAEYQGWLCEPPAAGAVLAGMLALLANALPGRQLQLKYLSDQMPLESIRSIVGPDSRVNWIVHRSPLLKLDRPTIQKSLDKKGNKSKLARLQRTGTLTFERLTGRDLSSSIMNRIAALYDFRQGAVNDSCPFTDDTIKKAFHLAWLARCPDAMDLTLLRLNGEIIAALLGLKTLHASHIAILAYAPEQAHDSPGKIHVYRTALALADDGRQWLDLTPGGDAWKERFATDHATVLELIVHGSAAAATLARLRAATRRVARRALRLTHLSPDHLRQFAQRARRMSAPSIARIVRRAIHEHVELRLYRLEVAKFDGCDHVAPASINALADLVRFEPVAAWQTRHNFLSGALTRIEAGERSYTIADARGLTHCGWLIRAQRSAHFTEIDERYDYPLPGAVLYDFFTAPRARGQGHYQKTIRQMLAALKVDGTTSIAYISTRADNIASRHVIEKAGFEWFCSLHVRRGLFGARRWRVTA